MGNFGNHLKLKEKFFNITDDEYDDVLKNEFEGERTALKGKNVYKDGVDTVYLYHFTESNAVYIGRTIYPKLRDHQHRTREKDTVYKYSKEIGIDIPEMKILEEGLTVLEGAEKEIYWEKYYRENGFTIINKKPCGSLGYMTRGKWSKRKCFEEAKKYKTRSEFQRNAGHAYHISMINGWIDEMDWLPSNDSHPNGYWKNKENLFEEARKYKTLKEFSDNSPAACAAAYRHSYIDELTWLEKKEKLPFGYWKDKEHVMEEARKYSSRNEFHSNNQSAYGAARKYGYLDNMYWFKEKPKSKYEKGMLKNEEYIVNIAKNYSSRSEFMKKDSGAYSAAQRYGFLEKLSWPDDKIQKPSGYWNDKERVMEEGKKYKTRTEFERGSNGAYAAAKKHGYLDEMSWFVSGLKKKRNRKKKGDIK